MGAESDQKSPPELDAIVDRVLAYDPKKAKAAEKRKAGSGKNESPTVYFSRPEKPPADD